MNMIYDRIYKKLQPILKALGDDDYVKLESSGFMDLHINRLYSPELGVTNISLAHRFVQNGDSMADPDMEVRIFDNMEQAEALTFQQDGGLPLYQRVYSESEDGRLMVRPKLKKDLNNFLNFWLGNLKKQGFFK